MPFVKLDCGILHSSLWIDHDARTVFVTALLMARPRKLREAMPALSSRNLDPLGYTVPPGEYGFVEAANVGIIKEAGLPKERGIEALERLASADLDSRTPDHEGRRMVRVVGGFVVLNFDHYRQKDHTGAERQARFREKKRACPLPPEEDESNALPPVTGRHVTQAEAEAERAKALLSSAKADSPGGAGARKVPAGKLLEMFHELCPTMPKVQRLTPERRKHVAARARSVDGDPLEWFRLLFTKAAASDFLAGRAGTFRASFDWLLSPTNSQKTLEGNFDNDARRQPTTSHARRNDARPATPDADKFAGWGEPTPAADATT